ncbi:uncharacterized protein LOC117649386 [Thrips palmi]|uniref:Uncharacterized protein LOC117649386 n=1 Tax=Thrips palmi TaxID=161013 RepID=A0A6P8ZSA0_THRPL|nr:uncharacterized protein LOC117649386 [Thrips palmi]XP_034247971.1 uncharacterized protein LOC117649386 [Thrips palmi]
MKSRVQSNVHLLTANAPSAKVQCHRTSNGSHSSLTNAFLKEGGALPSVLPVDDCSTDVPCKSKHPTRIRNQSLAVKKSKKEDSNDQLSTAQSASKLNTCQLEKKMEHLSSKLTKVQDILESHLIDAAETTIPSSSFDQDEDGSFSARDYTFLLLEMNGNISSLPYDPNEFSEKSFKK